MTGSPRHDGQPGERESLGWREWVALPGLGIRLVKAKVDTGTRTSTLHAFYVEPYEADGVARVRFGVHPLQHNSRRALECDHPLLDERWVSDSGGHRELRCVIVTTLVIGVRQFPVECTLTNRDTMAFRFLMGRTALAGRFSVDPARCYLAGRPGGRRHRPGA